MKRLIAVLLFILPAGLTGAQQRIDAIRLLEDLRTLSSDSFEGRAAGSEAGSRAADWIVKEFEARGVSACGESYRQDFPINGGTSTGTNVIGLIPGRTTPGRYLVLSAHYDHLGVRKGNIYNGADDNASGTVAMLSVATYFAKHRPAHSIVLAAFDAEEKGLQGAKAFLADPCIPEARIDMEVNLDMVSRSAGRVLFVSGTHQYPEMRSLLEEVRIGHGINLQFGHDLPGTGSDDWTHASDHGPFYERGIPFVYFGVEDHADYHGPGDDYENITPGFFIDAVDTILDAVILFDQNLDGIRTVNGR